MEEKERIIMDISNLIPVKEYAALHGVTPRAVQLKIKNGVLKAVKRGDIYLINRYEPYVDGRRKKKKE